MTRAEKILELAQQADEEQAIRDIEAVFRYHTGQHTESWRTTAALIIHNVAWKPDKAIAYIELALRNAGVLR